MSTAPSHPQPGFYERLVEERGFDPATIPSRTHEQFMQECNQEGWLGMIMLDFERSTGKFRPPSCTCNTRGIGKPRWDPDCPTHASTKSEETA